MRIPLKRTSHSGVCDDDIFSPWSLNLIIPTVRPFRWMVDNTGTNHTQIVVGGKRDSLKLPNYLYRSIDINDA